ncbi:cytochrome c oxidase assembly protein [Desulfosarcina ovata subsp. sediminis]|uniref:Cytochrome c oxidase assembly protein n=1 Tax=Desulfosarcina ovata subsp. sediminis TaxID=885957 RepID=A0A5K7ZWQ7_9BACT|nr:cytochrome d ubiquinol oxidase subunit II [Desulfosarcina ovata]BBO84693.1 cytochrome c oxidase assembly protein [Desulfosarcina ovata subsp. sediminis]
MLLQSVWFFLWGLLWAVFFMTDGFDMGIGSLYPLLGKSERDKNMMIHAMGPMWDGNEVWLITAGGVTFAAFPLVYAVMFSSLYSALMLILFALILRGVSFEFRNKVESAAWKKVWDTCIFLGSFLPALLFGVAFGNIFQGIPFDGDGVYQGTLLTLLNPYGLLAGVLFVCLFVMHGALWLAIRTDGDLAERAARLAGKLWPVLTGVAVVFLVATFIFTSLYDNYLATPVLFLVPLVAVAGLVGIRYFLMQQAFFKAWFSSAATIVACTFFGVIGLFPSLFPSSIDTAFSLTAFNASSSPLTLQIMLIVVVLFIPVVLAYQIWAYKLFSGKVTDDDLAHEETY